MKRVFLAVFFVLSAMQAFALQYEDPMLNMTVPSGLEQNQSYLEIEHKFFQSFAHYPDNDFFALLNWGSNIKIGVRSMLFQGLEAKVDYISLHREKIAGLSYVLKEPQLGFNAQADVQFINEQDLNLTGLAAPVKQDFFYQLSLQTEKFLDEKVYVSADIGYDAIENDPGIGLGIGVRTFEHFTILAEYYPLLKTIDGRNQACYSFGIKVDTYGHQFIIRAGNSDEIGSRDMMHGSANQDIYAGFEIMRLIAY